MLTINQIIDSIKQTDIDHEGKFKYILIKLEVNEFEWYFVRDYNQYGYHAQNFEHFCKETKDDVNWTLFTFDLEEGEINAELDGQVCKFKCLGGGRIEHSQQKKTLSIYGYSWLYGICDHQFSLKILRNFYKYDEKNMSTSNSGY